MPGLFGVLDIAARSMFVTQSGLQTTSHNISNVDTPGYSRQRVLLEAARPITNARGNLGTGVEQTQVERVIDSFVQKQLVQERSAFGSLRTQADMLARVEEILNEQQLPGVAAGLSELYSAFADLASATTPGAPAEREGLRSVAQSLVETLHRTDAQLRELQGGANAAIDTVVDQINDLSVRIAALNDEIVRLETVSPANDFRDQRDALLAELAELAPVTHFEQTNGSVVVLLSGSMPLAEGNRAHALQTAPDLANPFNPSFSRIFYDLNGVNMDVTANVGSGELGGLLAARDSILPAAIRSLDTVAYNLAVGVNGVHAAGTGLDGTVGDFFTALPTVVDAARDITLDANIVARSDAIAAGLTSDPGDNRNALALSMLRDAASPLFLPGDLPGPASGPSRTLLGHAAQITADVGQQARSAQAGRVEREQALDLLRNRRDEISGVSIDEEMTSLIHLQAVFQANARVISTVQTLLDDVLGLL